MAIIATENFTGANGSPWPASPNTWAFKVSSSHGTLDTNRGAMIATPGDLNSEAATLTSLSVADVDLTVDITIGSIVEQYGAIGVRSNNTWFGGVNFNPYQGYFIDIHLHTGNWQLKKGNNDGTATDLGSLQSQVLAANDTLRLRIRAIGSSIKAKVWNVTQSEAEPVWEVEVTDTSWPAAGYPFLEVSNGTGTNPTFYWDNFTASRPAEIVFGAGSSTGFGTTGTSGSGSASFSKSTLSSMVVGDLLVAWIHNQSSTTGGTITPPSGWIRYGPSLGTATWSASRLSGFYYYPLRSQTDIDNLPATITWTFSETSTRVACVVARAIGIDLDDIEDSASTSFVSVGGGTSLTIPGITTVSSSTLLIGGLHHQNAASTSSPVTTSFMTTFEEYKTSPSGSANANSGGVLGYEYRDSAGATGNRVANYDNATSSHSGALIALKVGGWSPSNAGGAYPVIVGTPTTFATGSQITQFTINKPSGLQDDDLLVMALASQSPTVTSDFASAGWSRISQSFVSSSAGQRIIAFYALPVPTASAVTATNFTFTSTDSSIGGRIVAEMFIVRGADLASPTSAISPYAGPASGQTVTVNPDAPSVPYNLLLVGYNANFTSAIDYTIATGPTGMTQQASLISSTAAQSKTALAVYQENIDAGSVISKSLVWNGAQSQTCGVAISIRAAASNPGQPTKYTIATDTLADGALYYTSSTDVLTTPYEVRPVHEGYSSVSAMLAASPFYVAHRGGSRVWPEMSLHAYTQSAFWGVGALELSVARTSDGVFFGLHDQYLDRTSLGVSTTTLNPQSMTWAEVQTYEILGSSAADNPAQPNQPYVRFEDIMAAYYNSHVFLIDPKYLNTSQRAELLDMMDAMPGTPTDKFIIKYYGVSGNAGNTSGQAYEAAQRGYERWGYFYQSDAANFAAYQARWSILGMDYNADQTTWNTITSYGQPVIGHITPDLAAANDALTKGADGLMVSGITSVVPRA